MFGGRCNGSGHAQEMETDDEEAGAGGTRNKVVGVMNEDLDWV